MQLAEPLLDFGFSTAKLVWVAAREPDLPKGMQPTMYSKLAMNVQARIEEGRAAVGVISANMGLVQAAATYSAIATGPEPLSKVAAGLVAYGAKKTSDYMVEQVIEQSGDRARVILAEGLKSTTLSDDQLRNMTPEEIGERVAEFKIGGQQIERILDDPESLRILQNHMIDMVSDNALEGLRRTAALGITVDRVREEMTEARAEIDFVRDAVETRTQEIEQQMGALADAVKANSSGLAELSGKLSLQETAMAAVAEISFSGWTTQQKLQAVRSNLVPGLDDAQKQALTRSLEAQQRQEKLVSQVSSAAGDLKAIADIARSLDLPDDLVKTVDTASTIATGAAQFLSGNYLGAISSVTSLFGMGKPDPVADRHQQMMEYLASQFAAVNERLDKMIDLQVKTIEALEKLRGEQQEFREEVLTQLSRIESITLINNRILQELLKAEWRSCDALVNSPEAMNGEFIIKGRDHLVALISDNESVKYILDCYEIMSRFLDGQVLPAEWQGTVISADAVPGLALPAGDVVHTQMRALQQIEDRAYTSAAALILAATNKDEIEQRPARLVSRLVQPMPSTDTAEEYRLALTDPTADGALTAFNCRDSEALSPGLKELLCFRIGARTVPNSDRLPILLRSPMLGPQVERLVNTGVLLATFADLSYYTPDRQMRLIRPSDLQALASNRVTKNLEAARRKPNRTRLLESVRRLSEMYVLQQSLTYGDYTARVAEQVLYDPATRTLNLTPIDPSKAALTAAAVDAMRANPVLARNVILLALRHSIADSLGSMEEAKKYYFLETRYRSSYENFLRGKNRCAPDEVALSEWKKLLPGWEIVYAATEAERRDAAFAACIPAQPLALGDIPQPDRRSGAAVKIADFYVTLPLSMELAIGKFEQPESLLGALTLRDHVNQAIAERNISATVAATVSDDAKPEESRKRLAFDLLNAQVISPN